MAGAARKRGLAKVRIRLTALALLCPLATGGAVHAAELAPDRQREILRDALSAFDQAVGVSREDTQRARELYEQAAAGFQALREAGVRNAALEYNLGNTYFRLGQPGRAILHYRRAEQRSPADRAIAANLKYARDRVEPRIRPTGQRELWGRLLFWNRTLNRSQRFWLAAAGSGLGWLVLIAWLRFRVRPLLTVALVLVVVGLANAGTVGWELRRDAETPPGVVVDGEYRLRLGRGEGYDPALAQPLGPGVEVRILQQRADWVEVRLANDQTGWLPAAAVERV